jgi:hypothetical protein
MLGWSRSGFRGLTVAGHYCGGSLRFTPHTLSYLTQEKIMGLKLSPHRQCGDMGMCGILGLLRETPYQGVSTNKYPKTLNALHPFSGRCGVSPHGGGPSAGSGQVCPQTASFIGGLGTRGNRSSVPPPAKTSNAPSSLIPHPSTLNPQPSTLNYLSSHHPSLGTTFALLLFTLASQPTPTPKEPPCPPHPPDGLKR